jgi:hypothetical protein
MTPAMVHHGQAPQILAHRQVVLDAAYSAHPERFVRKGRRRCPPRSGSTSRFGGKTSLNFYVPCLIFVDTHRSKNLVKLLPSNVVKLSREAMSFVWKTADSTQCLLARPSWRLRSQGGNFRSFWETRRGSDSIALFKKGIVAIIDVAVANSGASLVGTANAGVCRVSMLARCSDNTCLSNTKSVPLKLCIYSNFRVICGRDFRTGPIVWRNGRRDCDRTLRPLGLGWPSSTPARRRSSGSTRI